MKDIADKLIVIDTGSTDRTVERAREHGAQVGHFEWCNDLAAARNASIARPTRDWILFLDTDEELSPAEKQNLSALLNSNNVALIRLPLINLRVSEVVTHSLDVGGAHVDGHVLDGLGMPVVTQQFRSKSETEASLPGVAKTTLLASRSANTVR